MTKEELEKHVLERFNLVFKNYESDLNNTPDDLFSGLSEKLKIYTSYIESTDFNKMTQYFHELPATNSNTSNIIAEKLDELIADALSKVYN